MSLTFRVRVKEEYKGKFKYYIVVMVISSILGLKELP